MEASYPGEMAATVLRIIGGLVAIAGLITWYVMAVVRTPTDTGLGALLGLSFLLAGAGAQVLAAILENLIAMRGVTEGRPSGEQLPSSPQ